MSPPIAKMIRKEIDSVMLNCLTNDYLVSTVVANRKWTQMLIFD